MMSDSRKLQRLRLEFLQEAKEYIETLYTTLLASPRMWRDCYGLHIPSREASLLLSIHVLVIWSII